ncbi:hypothetical protein [Corynebacterium freiburgense]|uniref:hypothetical protein n=1 Tax=Corynebacterium freiburgense TaxID=556548 RepID=UPI0003FF8E8C|nr:hypothetical protein [Corynebacterium freiburgense]WJZ01636.1 hypothetical protein CFREI_01660 [Corynebacterium freiburgense]
MDCTTLCTVFAQEAANVTDLAAARAEGSAMWGAAAAGSLMVAAGALWADWMQQRRQRVEADR